MGWRGTACVLTALLGLLGCANSVRAADIGANDDTGKYEPDAGASVYREMASLGMNETIITVRWQPSDPLGLGERPLLDVTVAAARGAGLQVVFAAYPYPPREVADGSASPDAFGAWLAELARQYPDVREYIVGNEPNQPAFWRPQFFRTTPLSATTFGPFLAAGYDALKSVDPDLTVVGVGLSPRGNDRPDARSNVSTSPVRFLAELGAWYRHSGRERPLMDELSFHPYPNSARDGLDRGYGWPNAGFVNLGRIKQAVWDAFAGTPQPTTLDGLRLSLDEVGWQVDTTDRVGYTGEENVPVTDEESQARIYGDLVRRAACDPDIAAVNLFGFRDDALRTGFQAGLYRADGSARPALEAVRSAIAAGRCVTGAAAWRPTRAVLGAGRPTVLVARGGISVRLTAAEGAAARVCLVPTRAPATAARRAVSARGTVGTTCGAASIQANRVTTVKLARIVRRQTLAVRLSAEANPARTTTVVERLDPCLTPNTCSVIIRTDVRSILHRTRAPHRPRSPVPVGALRR
jgi:hypothetical protein